jgi:lysophospholipase L1-like esterase
MEVKMSGSKSIIFKVFLIVLLSLSIINIGSRLTTLYAAPTLKIMPVGDSCTDGMGDPNMGSYRTDLYKLYTNAGLSIDFVGSRKGGPGTLPDRDHEGHSGWMIPQIASNIDNWLNTYKPDVVLLWIGGNDMILGGNNNYRGLSNLIDQILRNKPNIKIFVADYYPVPDQIRQYNANIPGVVQEKTNAGKPVYFVKLSGMDFVRSTDLSSDGLHLNPNGYSKAAKIWFNSTISILQGTSPSASPSLSPSASISPSQSPSPSPSPSWSPSWGPSLSPSPSAITGAYAVTCNSYDWGRGATVNVTVKNSSTKAVTGWTLEWSFSGNQKITVLWNGAYTQSGTRVSVKNMPYNKTIPAGGSITLGFNISYSGSNAKPTGFTLNGTNCTVNN